MKPNIILISLDHLRADWLGCAGHPSIRTPHIDFLARRGVRFAGAVSTTPVCVPARAIIMTGRDAHTIGAAGASAGYRIPVRETLPQLLGEEGYETRAVGKMHVYPERCHYGFDSMMLWEEGRRFGQGGGEHRGYGDYEQWLAEQGYAGQAFAHGMANNEYNATPWHLPDHLHPTEWIGHEACKSVKRRDWTRPLFLWASFTAPHPPLTPLLRDLYGYEGEEIPDPAMGGWTDDYPQFHRKKLAQYEPERSSRAQRSRVYRAYMALVTQVDRQINRLLGTLREEGMLDNTWIIVTSDHGDNLGDHGLWAKSNFLRGACGIPLIVTPPLRGEGDSRIAKDWMPGRTNDSPVGLQDLLPTCLDIAGRPDVTGADGISLLPLVTGEREQVRDTIMGEIGKIGSRSMMLKDSCWKYIWYEQDGRELLFDIAADPDETADLAAARPETAVHWRERLVRLLARRDGDPALRDGMLAPSRPGHVLSDADIARSVHDMLPRGIH